MRAELLPPMRECGDAMSEYIYGTDGHEGHWLTGEEIVRCRDCRFYDNVHDMGCEKFSHVVNEPDGYCAWAERRGA